VDFWTYSCINCIRTFPHVQGWYATYKDSGLVVVGVHTPEFAFERDAANVQEARERYGLTYPTAQDNDYRIWNAYKNRYWPAEYLIDKYGRIRHTHFGEGNYQESEDHIRALLAEAGHAPSARRASVPGEPSFTAHSPELYMGEGQGRGALGNPEGYDTDTVHIFSMPAQLAPDRIYVAGTWKEEGESFTARGDGQVAVRFRGGGGNLVADGPPGLCLPVLLDGQPIPRDRAAKDVRFDQGAPCLALDGPRSYDFYAGPLEEHTVRLDVSAGFTLFTFDFATEGRT
jgi:thiol-disulfide isomerase/thioredoxin